MATARTVNVRTTPRLVTWGEYIKLPEDDRRELIDGVLVETEMPTELHEYIVARLITSLTVWADRARAGHVLGSGYKVRITRLRSFMPDVQFFRRTNKARREDAGLVRGHPDLVVEVTSEGSSRYDRNTKLMGYGAIGVPEYWIIDQFDRTLERLLLKQGRYSVEQVLAEDELLRPRSFPRLELPIRTLFDLPR